MVSDDGVIGDVDIKGPESARAQRCVSASGSGGRCAVAETGNCLCCLSVIMASARATRPRHSLAGVQESLLANGGDSNNVDDKRLCTACVPEDSLGEKAMRLLHRVSRSVVKNRARESPAEVAAPQTREV